jgi:predicted transcriptional regulator
MANIMEMVSEIVAAHASTTPMTKEELLKEVEDLHAALAAIEKGEGVTLPGGGVEAAEEEAAPAVSMRKAFGKKLIYCMICGKGMKTLARHLKTAHGMTAKEYREKFGIPRTQPLAAKDYSESRKQMAIDRGLGENLAKARAAKAKGKKTAAKAKEKPVKEKEAAEPAAE